MLGEVLVEEKRNGVFLVRVERPEKLNALNQYLWHRLGEVVESLCASPRARAIVVTGSGRAFSAGDDIFEMAGLETLVESRSFFEAASRAVRALLDCSKPLVAAVEGYAYGGGFELLLLFDIVVASKSSRFSAPEARLALFPPILSTIGVAVLGYKNAKKLALTGVELAASEARELGVVDIIVEDGETVEKALEIAYRLASLPPQGVLEAKKLARKSIEALIPVLREAVERLARLVLSPEAKESMKLFIESRKQKRK